VAGVNTNLEAVVDPQYPAVPIIRWPVHYTVVLLLCAAAFISYIDRTNISIAAIAIQAQLGWDETQKGLVLSSFFVGYLLMMVAAGVLAHRYGGKVVLGVAVVWWSLFTALTPPAALMSLPALVVARIALGLGEAAVFPASINMIGRWVPPSQRSRAVALLTSSLYLGTVIALPATGWLVRENRAADTGRKRKAVPPEAVPPVRAPRIVGQHRFRILNVLAMLFPIRTLNDPHEVPEGPIGSDVHSHAVE
jgi:MFS family permease